MKTDDFKPRSQQLALERWENEGGEIPEISRKRNRPPPKRVTPSLQLHASSSLLASPHFFL